mmetsp:Transcript_27185/g.54376  ORF Transcript_27185/g.54376 Transcript_27185/m.54376 type:complete len:226 (-) Transcript_27185:92-769(-)
MRPWSSATGAAASGAAPSDATPSGASAEVSHACDRPASRSFRRRSRSRDRTGAVTKQSALPKYPRSCRPYWKSFSCEGGFAAPARTWCPNPATAPESDGGQRSRASPSAAPTLAQAHSWQRSSSSRRARSRVSGASASAAAQVAAGADASDGAAASPLSRVSAVSSSSLRSAVSSSSSLRSAVRNSEVSALPAIGLAPSLLLFWCIICSRLLSRRGNAYCTFHIF